MLKWFICPDKQVAEVSACLQKCRMVQEGKSKHRCYTLPYLYHISREREWNGTPSTTQLLNGTMMEFLKLTQDYAIDPDSRAFATHGTLSHEVMQEAAESLNLSAEVPLTDGDKNVFDLLEPEGGGFVIVDYKTWGSYRVAKALGLVECGKIPDPNGEVYKSSGKWGKAGSPKMVAVWQQMPQAVDMWDVELQLNRYRIMLEALQVPIVGMRLQILVRDGGLAVASSRGITRNGYYIEVKRLDDEDVQEYFLAKEADLQTALEIKAWREPCDDRECWEGARCREYCDVSMFCSKGILYRRG